MNTWNGEKPYIYFKRELNKKVYELKDHLGNIRVVIKEVKSSVINAGTNFLPATFAAELEAYYNYYAFGMLQPGRNYDSPDYRYGFNGMEKDDEMKGDGTSYDFGARMYDPRVGRWWSCDPLAAKYPTLSSFSFCANTPVIAMDPNGEYVYFVINGQIFQVTVPALKNQDNNSVAWKSFKIASRLQSSLRKYIKDESHDIYYVVGSNMEMGGVALPNAVSFNKNFQYKPTFELDEEKYKNARKPYVYNSETQKGLAGVGEVTESELQALRQLNGIDVSKSKGKIYSMVMLSDQILGDNAKYSGGFISNEVTPENAPYEGALVIIHETEAHVDERDSQKNPGGLHTSDPELESDFDRNLRQAELHDLLRKMKEFDENEK